MGVSHSWEGLYLMSHGISESQGAKRLTTPGLDLGYPWVVCPQTGHPAIKTLQTRSNICRCLKPMNLLLRQVGNDKWKRTQAIWSPERNATGWMVIWGGHCMSHSLHLLPVGWFFSGSFPHPPQSPPVAAASQKPQASRRPWPPRRRRGSWRPSTSRRGERRHGF